MESLRVFHMATYGREDASALYYLGNMLFDHQPDSAMKCWEKALSIKDGNPVLHRNLGIAYERVKQDYNKAIAHYERSVEMNPDPRVIYELDVMYEKSSADMKTREKLFRENRKAIHGRVDAVTRMLLVQIQSEDYDDAIKTLSENYFYRWEGGNAIRTYYEDAYLLRGLNAYQKGKTKAALEDFKAALEYPENLEEGRPEHDPRFIQTFYCIGMAEEKLGNKELAMKYYRKAANEDPERTEYIFYRSMAWAKLGEKAKAEADVRKLLEMAEQGPRRDFFAKFGERRSESMILADQQYYMGLASEASGETTEAADFFGQALEANPNHIWARTHLRGLTP
jgi:tetratricopeptide (TPR) repeat protein